jgi:hypothetical protein
MAQAIAKEGGPTGGYPAGDESAGPDLFNR